MERKHFWSFKRELRYYLCRHQCHLLWYSHTMSEYDQEEVDAKLVIHLQDSVQNGATTRQLRTADTDILVIVIGRNLELQLHHTSLDNWVAFGTGNSFSFHCINAICHKLGRHKPQALALFHSFSGCGIASYSLAEERDHVGKLGSYTQMLLSLVSTFLTTHSHLQQQASLYLNSLSDLLLCCMTGLAA